MTRSQTNKLMEATQDDISEVRNVFSGRRTSHFPPLIRETPGSYQACAQRKKAKRCTRSGFKQHLSTGFDQRSSIPNATVFSLRKPNHPVLPPLHVFSSLDHLRTTIRDSNNKSWPRAALHSSLQQPRPRTRVLCRRRIRPAGLAGNTCPAEVAGIRTAAALEGATDLAGLDSSLVAAAADSSHWDQALGDIGCREPPSDCRGDNTGRRRGRLAQALSEAADRSERHISGWTCREEGMRVERD